MYAWIKPDLMLKIHGLDSKNIVFISKEKLMLWYESYVIVIKRSMKAKSMRILLKISYVKASMCGCFNVSILWYFAIFLKEGNVMVYLITYRIIHKNK